MAKVFLTTDFYGVCGDDPDAELLLRGFYAEEVKTWDVCPKFSFIDPSWWGKSAGELADRYGCPETDIRFHLYEVGLPILYRIERVEYLHIKEMPTVTVYGLRDSLILKEFTGSDAWFRYKEWLSSYEPPKSWSNPLPGEILPIDEDMSLECDYIINFPHWRMAE